MTTVVLLGMPKSGTSALYTAVKTGLEPELCMFEPGNSRQIAYLRDSPAPRKLTKILYPKFDQTDPASDLSFADRIVLIVRDPRDVLISWLLYRPLMHENFKDTAFLDEFVGALREKERDASAVSVRALHQIFDTHSIAYTRLKEYRHDYDVGLDLQERYPNMFVLRFEDFLDGRTEELSDYLGFTVQSKTTLGEHILHTERSKQYGGWRHWFTADDVETYRSSFGSTMDSYGYAQDWELAAEPVIDPATSSEYVLKNVARLTRNPNRYGVLHGAEHYNEHTIGVIRSAVEDGAEGAMIELALLHRSGIGVKRDSAAAFRLLDETARRGNTVGMLYLSLAYEFGDGAPADAERAKQIRSDAGAIMGNARAKAALLKARAQWAATSTGSIRSRVGAISRRLLPSRKH